MELSIVLLAAGQGTRMKSGEPKVLHALCGRSMVAYCADAAAAVKPTDFIAVVSPAAEKRIAAVLPEGVRTVVQDKPRGTGDAVMAAKEALSGFKGTIVVLCGDTPLITGQTLVDLVRTHESRAAAATVLTAKVSDPHGYGRIVRGGAGVKKIVEERDATDTELCIREVNTGTYCFSAPDLFAALDRIKPDNSQKEYYLTDVIGIFFAENKKVVPYQSADETETMGVNSRIQLADAEMIMQSRINREHMKNGVTMIHPMLTYIHAGVEIGKDTVVYPNTYLYGRTKVGSGCVLGPSFKATDCVIGDGCEASFSVAEKSEFAKRVKLGPFAYVRPETKVAAGGKVGTFVEIKNSTVGTDSKVPHLSYVGDTTIGKGVNIGAGTITCNYDGAEKHETVIGDRAFIGSDTILVAPVTIGKNAYTGAGSVITKDVPDGALAIERTEQKNLKKTVRAARKKVPADGQGASNEEGTVRS